VRLHGLKVHILENNAGLLERDAAAMAPFFHKFQIRCGKDLEDDALQVTYCLKAEIQKRFLRRMCAGTLDAELCSTVLIVDEVDDLIVNERPNTHYVKKDIERTPDLLSCFQALSRGETQKPARRRPLFPKCLGEVF
jgi:hypothetical protein